MEEGSGSIRDLSKTMKQEAGVGTWMLGVVGSLLSSYLYCPQLLKLQPCFEMSWSCCFELDLLPTLLLMETFDGY